MKWQYKFVVPSLVVILSIVIFPTIFLFYVSFHQWTPVSGPEKPFIGFSNFLYLITSSEFIQSVRASITYVLSVTVLSFIPGLGLALILTEKLKGRNFIRTLIALPIVIPPVVSGFAWKFLLAREVGMIGGYLLPLMGFKKSILGDPTLAMVSVILADIWSRTPLMFLIFLGGLQAIPIYLYEAAELDGASYWDSFKNVTLPLLKPAIVIALIIRFIDAFNLFDIIYVMTRGGPGTSTQTFPLLGWKVGFWYFNLGEASALGIIMLFITIGASLLIIRRLGRGMS